jgi:hypothetical protein
LQEVVPVPQAAHGKAVQDAEVKKSWQAPCAQTWLLAHGMPQKLPVEQNSGLEASSDGVQQPALPQKIVPGGQPLFIPAFTWQVPLTQRWPPPQLLPQAPQFPRSWRRSVHPMPPIMGQLVRPGRHTHAELMQAWLSLQAVPQAPQLIGLLAVSAQTMPKPIPGHIMPPAAQLHMPLVQTSPCSQAFRQLPQWAGSVGRLLQVAFGPMPQVVSPAGQVQTPATQVSPPGQAVPQVPQWAGLLARLAQPAIGPQLFWPAGQVQTPAVQVAPGPQWMPHAPQWLLSIASLTQPMTGPQSTWPVGQVHTAAMPVPVQVAPGPQMLLHVPQCMLPTVVHMLLQTIWPAVQLVWHVPFMQISVGAHGMPQPPQFMGSVAVAVHMPGLPLGGHLISPLGHAPQAPAVHIAPTGQPMPQPPQLTGSVMVLEHTPLQFIVPFGQAQWPETQAAPIGHAMPHPPQLLGSLEVLTQPLGQLVRFAPQTQAVTPPTVWQVEPVPQTLPHTPQLELSVVRSTHAPLQVVGLAVGQPQTPEVQTPPSMQA